MKKITTEAELDALYGEPNPKSISKVTQRITPLYRQWIDASRFVVISSVGPEGTDLSPRGEIGSVVQVADENTVLLPDWLGNNRLDTLRNIVRDSRVSVMFMVPGSDNVVRANGTAIVTTDLTLIESFAKGKKQPRSVVVITIKELYFQCAKALMRSQLWTSQPITDLPTAGDFLKEQDLAFDSVSYDQGYPEHAKKRMW